MSIFFRMAADKTKEPVTLAGQYAGTETSPCWLIGGGPSLNEMPISEIVDSPFPKMTTNLAGHGLLKPNFWTSYDPSIRFHQSVYLDPSIMKFVHPRRSMDLVPDTTFKVCDCPNLYFFETNKHRGFADFLSTRHSDIVDWNDTLVQAIDVLYQLGFRKIYLAGTEMIVSPSEDWIERAEQRGVSYESYMLLGDFAKQCETAGLSRQEQEEFGTADQYHFDERKPLAASISTDSHYFRVAQYLRLCRRSMSLAGLQLISTTPGSRLKEYFPYQSVETICEHEADRIGYPPAKSVTGFYTEKADRKPGGIGPMRDFRPHHWKENGRPVEAEQQPDKPQPDQQQELPDYLNAPPMVEIREEA